MKRLLLAFALPLAGCGAIDVIPMSGDTGSQVKGTGKSVVETRKAESASKVIASGALEIEIVAGATPKLTVEAQKEIQPHIVTKFERGTLTIETKGSMSTDGVMRVRYTTPNLSSVEANGATKINVPSFTSSQGSIVATGASKVSATGTIGTLNLNLTGASEAELKKTKVQTAKVEVAGASKAWLNVQTNLLVKASGASEVHYAGKPAHVTSEATGVSKVMSP